MRRFVESLSRNAKGVRITLLAYWGLMFLGTHLPKVPVPLEKVSDKTLHFLAYFGLMLLLTLDSVSRQRLTFLRLCGLLMLCAVYGIVDEILQIPAGRSADVRDWLADMRGVTLAASIAAAGLFLSRRGESYSTEK